MNRLFINSSFKNNFVFTLIFVNKKDVTFCMPHPYVKSNVNQSIIDGSTDNIKQLTCNSLLTTLVVLQVQFTQQLISIIGSCLHGNHTSSMF